MSIFASAAAGDTIKAVGSFGTFALQNRAFSTAVTIDATKALFTDSVTISGVTNLKIVGGTFGSATADTRTSRAVGVYSSSGILFSKNFFIGNGAGMGLTTAGSDGITVSAGNFSNLKLGFGVTSSRLVRISSSRFIGMTSDGINIADSHFVTAHANQCFNGVPGLNAHPDCIQLWSILGQPVQSDITLTSNIVNGPTQGLTSFNPDNGGGLRISMIGNTITTSYPQGIACYACVDSVFKNNILTTLPGSQFKTSMNIVGGSNNIILNNTINAKSASVDELGLPEIEPAISTDYYDEPLPDFVLEDLAYLASLGFNPNIDSPFDLDSSGLDTALARGFGASSAAVPEPMLWAQLLFGFGVAGTVVRRQRATRASA